MVVGEEHGEYRQQVQVEAHSPAKRGPAEQSARHRVARRRGRVSEHAERRGRVAARWVEAAHLLLAIDSTFSKILSAESRCAGSDNARALSRLRTAHRLSTERILRHSHGAVLCRKNASGLVR